MEFVLFECQKFDFSINKYTPFGWGRGSAHIVLKDTERFVKCECATAHWKPSFRGVSGSLCGGGGGTFPRLCHKYKFSVLSLTRGRFCVLVSGGFYRNT